MVSSSISDFEVVDTNWCQPFMKCANFENIMQFACFHVFFTEKYVLYHMFLRLYFLAKIRWFYVWTCIILWLVHESAYNTRMKISLAFTNEFKWLNMHFSLILTIFSVVNFYFSDVCNSEKKLKHPPIRCCARTVYICMGT